MIGNREHGFQTAQHAVGTPIFGQINRGAREVPIVFFEFGFKTFK